MAVRGAGLLRENLLTLEGMPILPGQAQGRILTSIVSRPWCYFHSFVRSQGKREFVDTVKVTNLLTWREGDYAEFSGCAQWIHMNPFIRKGRRGMWSTGKTWCVLLAGRWKEPHEIMLFPIMCATSILRNIFYTCSSESVSRKSKLRYHTLFLFHRGITLEELVLKWVKKKLCMVKLTLKIS